MDLGRDSAGCENLLDSSCIAKSVKTNGSLGLRCSFFHLSSSSEKTQSQTTVKSFSLRDMIFMGQSATFCFVSFL